MDLLTYYRTVFYVLTGLIGLCVGSFLNVVIYRVPLRMSVAFPASHCPKCGKAIAWYDNIPVLSYLLLGGKCRHCRDPISFRYTAVELGNTLLWLVCALRVASWGLAYTLISMAVCSVLLCVFFIDWEHQIIPDRFQVILAVLAVGAVLTDRSSLSGGVHWLSNLIGAVAGFGVFFLIGAVMTRILGQEALGGGDVKLSAVMGLFLGWQKWLLAVLIASLSASILLILLKKIRKNDQKEYPFAPFLATGFAVSMLFGDAILLWYISLLIG